MWVVCVYGCVCVCMVCVYVCMCVCGCVCMYVFSLGLNSSILSIEQHNINRYLPKIYVYVVIGS